MLHKVSGLCYEIKGILQLTTLSSEGRCNMIIRVFLAHINYFQLFLLFLGDQRKQRKTDEICAGK
jgi:hypothetical protein